MSKLNSVAVGSLNESFEEFAKKICVDSAEAIEALTKSADHIERGLAELVLKAAEGGKQ